MFLPVTGGTELQDFQRLRVIVMMVMLIVDITGTFIEDGEAVGVLFCQGLGVDLVLVRLLPAQSSFAVRFKGGFRGFALRPAFGRAVLLCAFRSEFLTADGTGLCRWSAGPLIHPANHTGDATLFGIIRFYFFGSLLLSGKRCRLQLLAAPDAELPAAIVPVLANTFRADAVTIVSLIRFATGVAEVGVSHHV